jgi:ABC-2 type transport system ATP-binding protein
MTTNEAASSPPTTIAAQNVSKVFGEFAALQDVSFTVKKGTVAAFLGPNGAGKSTAMRILTGYLAPTSGKVELAGLDPTDADHRLELARRLGYLPENGPLYPDMTPLESLGFFAEVRRLEQDALKKAIDRVVERCAIGSVMQKPIHKLSKGFKQRVGVAQAMLHDPEVLIMDEPTSGLDPLQIREVRALIRELGKTKTILLSTHILQEVEAVADEVILIHEGRIAFAGGREALKREGTLEQRFYELTGDEPEKGAA